MRVSKEDLPVAIDKDLDMPTIPLVLTKIIQVLDDDATSARELEELILHDASLSARILKLANSAFYSFRSEVKTISHAIPLLGLTLVKSLAIGVSIFDSFTKGMKSEAVLIHQLWKHSFGVALLTQEIWTPRSNRKEGEFAFLCGLLHDLGKVFFFKRDPTQYSPLFAVEKSETDPDLLVYEQDQYGMDHPTVGCALAKRWGLPPDLAKAIAEHHNPVNCQMPLVAAVAMADSLTKQANIGYDGEKPLNLDLVGVQEILKMRPDEYERLSTSLTLRRRDVEEYFKLSA